MLTTTTITLATLTRWRDKTRAAVHAQLPAPLRHSVLALDGYLRAHSVLRTTYSSALHRASATPSASDLFQRLCLATNTGTDTPLSEPHKHIPALVFREAGHLTARAFLSWDPAFGPDGRRQPPHLEFGSAPAAIRELRFEHTDPHLPAVDILAFEYFAGFFASADSAALAARQNNHAWMPYDFALVSHCVDELCDYLSRALAEGQAALAAVMRFRAYVEWYARDRVLRLVQTARQRPGKRTSFERPLHDLINEFLFGQGYLPIVNPKLLGDEADTLVGPRGPVDGESLLAIEVKQYFSGKNSLGRSPYPSEVVAAVSQCIRYARSLQAAGARCSQGAVILFYGGKNPVASIEPPWVAYRGVRISVVGIYLGPGSASSASRVLRWQAHEAAEPIDHSA